MKKLTTAIAAIALFFSAAAFTPDSGKNELLSVFKVANVKAVSAANVTKSVIRAFNARYAAAKDVTWTQAESFFFATFDLQQGNFSAAFNEEGEFIAVARKLSFDQVSMAAAEAIREQYKDFIIPPSVNEIVLLGETNYYLTVENKNAYLQLKCSPDGNISVEKRIKKKVLVGKVY